MGNLLITFKLTAPSKLYWAGRPGMRIVQAFYWLHDALEGASSNIETIWIYCMLAPVHLQ